MPEPELHSPQVLSTAVEQCRLGPAQRMRAELLRVPADEAYQALHDPCVQPDRIDTFPSMVQRVAGPHSE